MKSFINRNIIKYNRNSKKGTVFLAKEGKRQRDVKKDIKGLGGSLYDKVCT